MPFRGQLSIAFGWLAGAEFGFDEMTLFEAGLEAAAFRRLDFRIGFAAAFFLGAAFAGNEGTLFTTACTAFFTTLRNAPAAELMDLTLDWAGLGLRAAGFFMWLW
jgi:hypothetical protein